MSIRNIMMGAAMVAAMGLTTACEPACSGMTATENEKKVLELGGEVEREDSAGNECELDVNGNWSVDH